jgi:hypothetical protein
MDVEEGKKYDVDGWVLCLSRVVGLRKEKNRQKKVD